MPRKSPILQKHHVLEQQTFKNNDFLQALVEAELVEKDVFENLLYMPADKRLAAVMGVSPHGGGPIKDYQTGITLLWSRSRHPRTVRQRFAVTQQQWSALPPG